MLWAVLQAVPFRERRWAIAEPVTHETRYGSRNHRTTPTRDTAPAQPLADETPHHKTTMHAGTRGGGRPLEALPYTYLRVRKMPG